MSRDHEFTPTAHAIHVSTYKILVDVDKIDGM